MKRVVRLLVASALGLVGLVGCEEEMQILWEGDVVTPETPTTQKPGAQTGQPGNTQNPGNSDSGVISGPEGTTGSDAPGSMTDEPGGTTGSGESGEPGGTTGSGESGEPGGTTGSGETGEPGGTTGSGEPSEPGGTTEPIELVCSPACDANHVCIDGICVLSCSGGRSECNGNCVDLDALHLESCNACEANYCDGDGNLANGCEIYAKGDDNNNCGGCGKVCDGTCSDGKCIPAATRRAMVMQASGITANADGSGGSVASPQKYDYVQVVSNNGSMAQVKFGGKTGWIASSKLMDACDECEGRKAIDLAENYLYTKTNLCTFDFLSHSPHLDNFTDLSGYGTTFNYGYDSNCANFVTAILVSTSLISAKNNIVSNLRDYCAGGADGYRSLPSSQFSQAKPGDIWICGDQHAELVVGYHNGALLLIGSNNFGSSDSAYNCVNTYSGDPTDYQRVSYGSAQWCSYTQYVLSRQ